MSNSKRWQLPPQRGLVSNKLPQSWKLPPSRPAKQLSSHNRLVLQVPADELNATVSNEIILGFWNIGIPLILDVCAKPKVVEIAVICEGFHKDKVERGLRGASSQIDIVESSPSETPIFKHQLVSYIGQGTRLKVAPIKGIDDFAKDKLDPLHSILESIMPIAEGEEFHFYIALRPAQAEKLQEIAKKLYFKPSLFDRIFLGAPNRQFPVYEPKMQVTFEERLFHQPSFEMLGIISLAGNHLPSLKSRAYSFSSTFFTRFYAGFGGIEPSPWEETKRSALPSFKTVSTDEWLLATVPEIASFWHPFSSSVNVPGVKFLKYPIVQLPEVLLDAQGISLGTYRYRGKEISINLPLRDLHTTHFAIPAGQTGMGKSTTFTHVAAQLLRHHDFPYHGFPSLVTIDPHGTLNMSIASRVIPENRIDKTYLFEPSDVENPFGTPFFRKPTNISLDDFIQVVFNLLHLIFQDQWSATRMADAIHAITATLCTIPNSSLLDAPRLLSNPDFRRKKLPLIDDG